MLVLLPFLSFGLLLALVAACRTSPAGSADPDRGPERTLARCFLLATLAFGVLVVIITELLGTFHELTPGFVGGAWAVVSVASAVVLLRTAGRHRWSGLVGAARSSSRDRDRTVLLVGAAGVLAVTAVIAWFAAPNNWDSLAYHLPRVAHWEQQRSLGFFATNNAGQLHLTPGAEFFILHLDLLSGTDRLDNFVQWFAMAATLVVIWELAGAIGMGVRGRALAVAAVATLPMGILQSTSTQDDYVASFWIALAVLLVMTFPVAAVSRSRGSLHRVQVDAAALGAAVGLAIFTKATAYVFLFPFGIVLLVRLLAAARGASRRRLLTLASSAAVIAVVALTVNAGQFARNEQLYGSPIGPSGEGAHGELRYLNGSFGPRELASNLLRNTTQQLGTPWPAVNRGLQHVVAGAHRLIGIGMDDRRTNFGGTLFSIRQTSNGEDTAGNPLHVLLGSLALVMLSMSWRSRSVRPAAVYAAAVVSGWVVFSLLLRWQPWSPHFELPAFVLLCPIIGTLAETIHRSTVTIGLSSLLFAASVPWLVANRYRPLVDVPALGTVSSVLTTPRSAQYFAHRPELASAYREAARAVTAAESTRVGLILHFEEWEYPLWILLRAQRHQRPVLESVLVSDFSRRLEHPAFFGAVVCVSCRAEETTALTGAGYRLVVAGPVAVYEGGEGTAPLSGLPAAPGSAHLAVPTTP